MNGKIVVSHMNYHVITHKKPLYVLLSFCYALTYKVFKIFYNVENKKDIVNIQNLAQFLIYLRTSYYNTWF
jgi:hypothetical protein